MYLPSGQTYNASGSDPIPGLSRQSYPDETQVEQLQMRHLLQLGFADLKIRKLIAHLKEIGLYDKALIVVTADHGVAFEQGLFDRRKATEDTWDALSPVPLFVKQPHQKRGQVNEEIVETTDVLPTIADLLDLELPEKTDGKSAFSAAVKGRTEVKMLKRDLSGWLRADGDAFNQRKRTQLEHKVALFGTGRDGADRIYRVGPNQELIGKTVAPLAAGESSARVELTNPGAYDDVDPQGPEIPTWVTGHVSGADDELDVAIAVNGTVRAVSNTFALANRRDDGLIAALLPPSALSPGKNRIAVYEVTSGRLALMGKN
jgi:hypothetical protein